MEPHGDGGTRRRHDREAHRSLLENMLFKEPEAAEDISAGFDNPERQG